MSDLSKGLGKPPVDRSLRFFFSEIIFFAPSEISGAIITSVKISVTNFAVSSSSFLLKATIPPKAEVESHFKAS